MHSRQGIVGPSFITSVRRSLQNKYKEDIRIRNLIEELGAERGLKPDEAEVTKQAHDEVSARLYYTSLLDGLWQEIYEVQQTLQGLHVYDSLEREFSDVDAENEFGDSIDNVMLEDVDINGLGGAVQVREDRAMAERHDGTMASRAAGDVMPRHNKSEVVTRQDGDVAVRPESGDVAMRKEAAVPMTKPVGMPVEKENNLPTPRQSSVPVKTGRPVIVGEDATTIDVTALMECMDSKSLKKLGKILKKAGHKAKKAEKAAHKEKKHGKKHGAHAKDKPCKGCKTKCNPCKKDKK